MSDCCKRYKMRGGDEKKLLINRLKRIEGQVRGVIAMLEDNSYCVDILNQVSAISSALSSFSRELLREHIEGCVVEDILAGKEDTAAELVEVVSKFVK